MSIKRKRNFEQFESNKKIKLKHLEFNLIEHKLTKYNKLQHIVDKKLREILANFSTFHQFDYLFEEIRRIHKMCNVNINDNEMIIKHNSIFVNLAPHIVYHEILQTLNECVNMLFNI